MPDRCAASRATDIEALVIKSVREHLKPVEPIDDRNLIETHIMRVEVQPNQLVIRLAQLEGFDHKASAENLLHIAWRKVPAKRHREILLPEGPSGRMSLISSRQQLMVDFRAAWALPASPTCQPNGRSNTRCWAFLPVNSRFEPSFCEPVSVSGKRNFAGRDKAARKGPKDQALFSRDQSLARIPAKSGECAASREIYIYRRVRGGDERTRTACRAGSPIEPVSEVPCSLDSPPNAARRRLPPSRLLGLSGSAAKTPCN